MRKKALLSWTLRRTADSWCEMDRNEIDGGCVSTTSKHATRWSRDRGRYFATNGIVSFIRSSFQLHCQIRRPRNSSCILTRHYKSPHCQLCRVFCVLVVVAFIFIVKADEHGRQNGKPLVALALRRAFLCRRLRWSLPTRLLSKFPEKSPSRAK